MLSKKPVISGMFPKFHDVLGKCKNIEFLGITGNFIIYPENIGSFILAIFSQEIMMMMEFKLSTQAPDTAPWLPPATF